MGKASAVGALELMKIEHFFENKMGRAIEITAVALLVIGLLAMGLYALVVSGAHPVAGIILISLSVVALFPLYYLISHHKKETVKEETSEENVKFASIDESLTLEQLKAPDFPWERLSKEQIAELFPTKGKNPFVVLDTKRKLGELGNVNIARWAPLLSVELLCLLKPEQLSALAFPWEKLSEEQGSALFPYPSGGEGFIDRNTTLHKLRTLTQQTIDFLKARGWITDVHLEAMRSVSTT